MARDWTGTRVLQEGYRAARRSNLGGIDTWPRLDVLLHSSSGRSGFVRIAREDNQRSGDGPPGGGPVQSLRDLGKDICCPISRLAFHQNSASSRVSAVEASLGPGPIALEVRAEVFRPEAVAPAHVALAAGSAVPVQEAY